MFSIFGRDRERIVSMTQIQASGAVLLAQGWQERGFTDIRIDRDGRSYALADFRRHVAMCNALTQRDRFDAAPALADMIVSIA